MITVGGESIRFLLWLVLVGEEPVEDLMAKEDEFAAAWSAVGGDDPFSDSSSYDLFIGVQKLGDAQR